MNIEMLSDEKTGLTVKLAGEMDAAACSMIQHKLNTIIHQKTQNVVLDLSQVNFIDSSGIGAIVFLFKRLKAQNRQMTLSNVNGQPMELMELLRIGSVITVTAPSVEQALS